MVSFVLLRKGGGWWGGGGAAGVWGAAGVCVCVVQAHVSGTDRKTSTAACLNTRTVTVAVAQVWSVAAMKSS